MTRLRLLAVPTAALVLLGLAGNAGAVTDPLGIPLGCVGVTGSEGTFEGYCISRNGCVGLYYVKSNPPADVGFGWGVACPAAGEFVCADHWDNRQGFDEHSCLIVLLPPGALLLA